MTGSGTRAGSGVAGTGVRSRRTVRSGSPISAMSNLHHAYETLIVLRTVEVSSLEPPDDNLSVSTAQFQLDLTVNHPLQDERVAGR